jgi:hypothetical protein
VSPDLNDADGLEAELRALRPRAVSPEFRAAVGAARPRTPRRPIIARTALAASFLGVVAGSAWMFRTHVEPPEPPRAVDVIAPVSEADLPVSCECRVRFTQKPSRSIETAPGRPSTQSDRPTRGHAVRLDRASTGVVRS